MRLKTLSEFISQANQIYNFKYDYGKFIYLGDGIPGIIICPGHGEFKQSPSNHLAGKECCKICCRTGRAISTQEFIERCAKIFPEYDYSLVKYIKSQTKVLIICPKHGEFYQSPDAIFNKNRGCQTCELESRRIPFEEFVERSEEVHKNKYSYYQEDYICSQELCRINCKIHGDFWQVAHYHLLGKSCKFCATNSISKKETYWLNLWKIPQEWRNIYLGKYRPDAVDVEGRKIWEFYGDWWHGNPKIYPPMKIHSVNKKPYGLLFNRTKEREDYLKSRGYSLIILWEKDYNYLIKYSPEKLTDINYLKSLEI